MAIHIRAMSPADFDDLEMVLARAYGRAGEWRWELEHFVPLHPEGWFSAEVDGTLAGMGGSTFYGPFAWIGLMGVDPTFQRRGVGAAILETILEHLDQSGCPLAMLDASVAGAPMYRQYGFRDDGATVLLEAGAPSGGTTSERVRAFVEEDMDEVIPFDTAMFGADRQALLRTLFDASPGRGFVSRDDRGAISGYVFALPDRIGPLIATDSLDAEALLSTALALPFHGRPTIRVPDANRAALDLAQKLGFIELRALQHMYRGAGPAVQSMARIYGEVSFAVG